jgi:hypothetical protein
MRDERYVLVAIEGWNFTFFRADQDEP